LDNTVKQVFFFGEKRDLAEEVKECERVGMGSRWEESVSEFLADFFFE